VHTLDLVIHSLTIVTSHGKIVSLPCLTCVRVGNQKPSDPSQTVHIELVENQRRL